MGQNMVGWVRFKVDLPTGTKLSIYHSEVLQQGNFYTENLRTEKQVYHYISNGKPSTVQPNFAFAKAEVQTAAGLYKSGWELKDDGTVCVNIEIPFDAETELTLPRATISNTHGIHNLKAIATSDGVVLTLPSGKYNFEYTPTVSFLPHFDLNTPIVDILDHNKAKEILLKHLPQLSNPMAMSFIQRSSINDMLNASQIRGQLGTINLEQLTADLAEIKS